MSAFKSVFAAMMDEYLSVRQMALTPGTYEIDRYVLEDFDAYLTERGAVEKVVTEETLNGWIQRLKSKNHSRTASNKVSCLRGFLKYLRYCGISAFLPQCPKYHEDYVPYIFSDIEVEKIFLVADNAATHTGSKVSFEVAMLLRLLYGCGLRHGEALHIERRDVDFECGTLLLRQAKNNKQRIVPMHKSLSETLLRYCAAMEIIDKPTVFLFPGANHDSPISISTVGNRFRAILKSAGIYISPPQAGKRGQCIHCLRHLFAIKSFAQAERVGRPTADSVPYLSVYLGHFDMDGTEKYLKFSSDIFPEHTEMFEAYSAGVFSPIGGAE